MTSKFVLQPQQNVRKTRKKMGRGAEQFLASTEEFQHICELKSSNGLTLPFDISRLLKDGKVLLMHNL